MNNETRKRQEKRRPAREVIYPVGYMAYLAMYYDDDEEPPYAELRQMEIPFSDHVSVLNMKGL